MRQHLTMFANFICKFGDENMVDYLCEVVLPAFTDDTLVREAYGSTFHLLDVEILETLDENTDDPAIVGQFVRDTLLRRTQVFDARSGKLRPDEAFLETSPSAFFVLLLRDHRLIYFAETPDTPDLKMFQSTIDRFILRKYHSYITTLYNTDREVGGKITKKALRQIIIEPTLTIVPLTNADELRNFVERFDVLKRVYIVVHRKNDEISTNSLIANATAFNEKLRGASTKISTSDPKGLDKEGAISALEEGTDGANETVKLSGQDANGDKLEGDNDEFSVKAVLDHVVGNIQQKAMQLYRKFLDLADDETIRRPEFDQASAAAIRQVIGNGQKE